jgi:NTP pyrophosphatase (non-canonical NTP hydrolase)
MARECVEKFAELMEERLAANDYKCGWADADTDYLLGRIEDEVHELKEALFEHDWVRTGSKELAINVRKECADVANFAMMIADVLCDETI